ncbi:biopolymer transporter ExbD [Stappia sp. TSB10GB4]|uniref:ExbD/TolR family protein n=1 Tax=Stappia sp. TSB10GB4 TaxID=2003584 RepID=UPI0016444E9C|nr:biopolymer transporter ExbD [Stappia sp. TSB10GB4]
MIRIRQKPPKRQAESTISLINIVFLMLIFFLIAGQLAPPVEPSVTLAETVEAPPLAPPDALFVDKDGALTYRGQPADIAAYLAALSGGRAGEGSDDEGGPSVMLAVDRDLGAARVLEIAEDLYRAGAGGVSLVTSGVER